MKLNYKCTFKDMLQGRQIYVMKLCKANDDDDYEGDDDDYEVEVCIHEYDNEHN